MLRRISLSLYMMRIPFFVLILLGVVLPMTMGSPMFHGLADLETNQISIVSMSAFLLVSAAITCAFLVLLYGDDRADGERRSFEPRSATASLPQRHPLSGWIVGGMYAISTLAYLRFMFVILQTMKQAHPNPVGLAGLFWFKALEGALAGAVGISIVFVVELWISEPRDAPEIGVFALPLVYLFRDLGWMKDALHSLSSARPGNQIRKSWLILKLQELRLFFVWILGPGYGQFDSNGKPVTFNPGHGFAGMFAVLCLAMYWLAGIGVHAQLTSDGAFEPARARDAVLLQVLLLLLLACWLVSGLTFYFDRFRVLVLIPIIALLTLTSRFGTSDHSFHTFDRSPAIVAMPTAQARFAAAPDHIIAVAAAGGGIQAAGWTSQVLCGLRKDLGPSFERNVLVISGVSGGAIGAVFYLRCMESPATSAEPAVAATNSSLEAIAWGLVHPDLRHAILPVQGLWWPGDDRGWALERAIRKNAQFMPLDRLLTSRSSTENWPVILFNSTEARTGDPFVFTNSDFPSKTSEPENHKLHGFHKIYVGRDVLLETAARMSAAFPYVSPAARADTPWNAEHLVDGGYFENSGMFSLSEWLKEGAVDIHRDVSPGTPMPAAKKILILQIDAFPDSTWSGPGDKPKGWAYQLVAPILTILHVRSEGALVRDVTERADLLELLTQRGYDASAITARYVPNVGSRNVGLPITCPDEPPLTWHLTEVEKICIRQNWADIEPNLISQLQTFLNNPVARRPVSSSVSDERLREGLYLQRMVKQ